MSFTPAMKTQLISVGIHCVHAAIGAMAAYAYMHVTGTDLGVWGPAFAVIAAELSRNGAMAAQTALEAVKK